MHPYLSSSIAHERRIDIIRSAEQDRILREADVPTRVDIIRLSLGRGIVSLGRLVAGRRLWIPATDARTGAPATTSALTLAR